MNSVNTNTTKMPFAKQVQEFGKFKAAYPRFVGNLAVNFFKDSFRRQGFINQGGVQKWKAREPAWGKKNNNGRAILVKSGRLRRSIRIIRTGLGYVQVGTDVPYARIHNEGGNIRTTQNVGSFKRKAYKRKKFERSWKGTKHMVRAHQVSAATVGAYKRKVDINIEQRQYMGLSAFLLKRIIVNTDYKIKRILNIR